MNIDKIKKDKRVKKAKQLLRSAIKDHQRAITGLKNPDKSLVKNYAALVKKSADLRGRGLYYPYISSGLGRGALVKLADGSVKYDFITGIGVFYMGHSNLKLMEASVDAALEDTLMQGNLQQSSIAVEVLDRFVHLACRRGAKLTHGFLSSSGAMANENAFKIIFQKHSPADRFLAFERCFSGRTMIMAQVTDNPGHRVGLPKVLNVDYVPFYDARRYKESTRRAADCLKKHIRKHPGKHAGMIMELVQGEGGYYAGCREFFLALIKILKKNNIAVMFDEIQTFGRTTEAFAFQYFGLDKYADVVSVGKLTQACATLFTDQYNPKEGLISQTFAASTSAMYAAKVILEDLKDGGLLGKKGKVARLSDHFRNRLQEIAKRHPQILEGPFGLGAMIGMTAFKGSPEHNKIFLQTLFRNGVMAFQAGRNPTRVRFLIPVAAVTAKDIDVAGKVIEHTLIEVNQKIGKKL